MSEVHVEMYRPERRFGWAAVVYRDDPIDGKRRVLHHAPDGFEVWDEVDPEAQVQPTFFFDDQVMDALTRVWQKTGSANVVESQRVDQVLAVSLEDAREVRDRLLTIVEKSTP